MAIIENYMRGMAFIRERCKFEDGPFIRKNMVATLELLLLFLKMSTTLLLRCFSSVQVIMIL